MDRSTLFWISFGAAIILIPGIADRLLSGRVADWLRFVLCLLVAALTGLIFMPIGRMLGV